MITLIIPTDKRTCSIYFLQCHINFVGRDRSDSCGGHARISVAEVHLNKHSDQGHNDYAIYRHDTTNCLYMIVYLNI